MAVKPVPEGYHTITPALSLDDAAGAIEFYKRALGAQERYRMPMADGKIAHAELQIGDSIVMLSDMFEQSHGITPKDAGGTTVSMFLYVDDCDNWFRRAVDAGATPTMEPEDQFWGDRFSRVRDPYGHDWAFATHVEDLSEEEMQRRSQEAMAAMSS
jgi:PhnB protein